MRVTKVDPKYPPEALQARVQGMVRLQVRITKEGNVYRVELVSGHPLLAPAALEAVKQWKYKPYLLNAEPIQLETIVQLTFTLPNEHAGNATVTDSPLDPAPPANGSQNIRRTNPEAIGVVGDVPGGVPRADSNTATASPIPALGTPQRVRVSSGVEQGLLVTKVNPDYPPDAKQQHIQGLVVMKVIIGKDGNVESAELISGHPLLAPAALDAVKQWKFKPYLLNGNPIEAESQIQVNFDW
jgi:TonB family protein